MLPTLSANGNPKTSAGVPPSGTAFFCAWRSRLSALRFSRHNSHLLGFLPFEWMMKTLEHA